MSLDRFLSAFHNRFVSMLRGRSPNTREAMNYVHKKVKHNFHVTWKLNGMNMMDDEWAHAWIDHHLVAIQRHVDDFVRKEAAGTLHLEDEPKNFIVGCYSSTCPYRPR